ncbi:MAG: menaquinone biosynthesis protein [Verrucomicrobiota bacterium]|nr:menaquinone biosynthesis protein [Verrucomicrobiota bacterium]
MAEGGLLRIGCVKYLNARPLIHGWPGEVVFDHPSVLCERLAAGQLDVALVSSFEFLRNPVYTLVDGISISSNGPVHSVFVAHNGNLSEIEEIEVDPASQTGINLLRCLLAEMGLAPKFVIRSRLVQRAITPRLAKFFIGDQAIRFRDETENTFQFWDLGEEWQKRTQLPFVYALWLIRPEVPSPKAIADGLRARRDNNIRELDLLVADDREFSPDFCQFYLRQCIRYQYGTQEKEGLSMFRKLCEKHGILWHDSRLII